MMAQHDQRLGREKMVLHDVMCANGGAKLGHGSGGMAPSWRSKTLQIGSPPESLSSLLRK